MITFKQFFKTFLAVSVCLALFSCNNSDDINSVINNADNGSIKYKINGDQIENIGSEQVSCRMSQGSMKFTISGSDPIFNVLLHDNFIQINVINVENINDLVGASLPYVSQAASDEEMAFGIVYSKASSPANSFTATSINSTIGSLNITSVSGNKLNGTFSATLYESEDLTNPTIITEGIINDVNIGIY